MCTVVVFCREDEVAKHSNGLVVKTFHQSRKKSAGNIILRNAYNGNSELHDVDVIISTTTFAWPDKSGSTLYKFVLSSCDNNDSTSLCYPVTKNVDFHRVVHDESHLFSTNSADIKKANQIISSLRWGVTATPMATSAKDLRSQLSSSKEDLTVPP